MTDDLVARLREVASYLGRIGASPTEIVLQLTVLEAADALQRGNEDAERYRWLRNSHNQGANTPDGEGLVVVTDRPAKEPRYIGPLAWQLLDAAIDAARKAK